MTPFLYIESFANQHFLLFQDSCGAKSPANKDALLCFDLCTIMWIMEHVHSEIGCVAIPVRIKVLGCVAGSGWSRELKLMPTLDEVLKFPVHKCTTQSLYTYPTGSRT